MSFNITYSKFRFCLEVSERMELPRYKGSLIRGALGRSLKKICCMQGGRLEADCTACMYRGYCPYSYVFESPAEAFSEQGALHKHMPHPFVLEPGDMNTDYLPGDEIYFDLLLLGRGNEFFPYFIAAVERASMHGLGYQRGTCELKTVYQLTGEEQVLIWNGGLCFMDMPAVYVLGDINVPGDSVSERDVTVLFQTPARLQNEGHLTTDLGFGLLMRAVLRRLDLLCRAYSEKSDLPFKELLAEAGEVETVSSHLHWVDWSRYSARQKTKLLMGGAVGDITFKQVPAKFLPYLYMASVVHIGKGTVYGLGKLDIK